MGANLSLQAIGDDCLKRGFRGEEIFYVYSKMKELFEKFSMREQKNEAQLLMYSLPKQMFFNKYGHYIDPIGTSSWTT